MAHSSRGSCAKNKAAAAAKARDIYLSLQASGWEATLAQYKAKAVEPKIENSTVGDLICVVAETTSYRATTCAVYCAAFHSDVVADNHDLDALCKELQSA